MSSVTINGHTYTDDSNATTGLAAGGHRTRFIPLCSDMVGLASTIVDVMTGEVLASGVVNTPAGNLIATDVQAAINELDTEKAALSGATFTGVVTLPDGTVGAPSITNTGDTNVGIYFPEVDTIAITTAGVERARVDSTGLTTFTGVVAFPDGTVSAPGITNDGDANTGIYFPAADTAAITTGGSERVRIASNILINTTTDDASGAKLQVNGALKIAPGASVTPANNGDVVFELTNNTTFTIKAKGSDGTVRSVALTLA